MSNKLKGLLSKNRVEYLGYGIVLRNGKMYTNRLYDATLDRDVEVYLKDGNLYCDLELIDKWSGRHLIEPHRLDMMVYMTYVNPDLKPVNREWDIIHKDGNPLNCSLDNLILRIDY